MGCRYVAKHRYLNLPPILDFLLEDSVFVADAITNGRDFQCCQGIHEAGREATEAAVAETWLLLGIQDGFQVKTQVLHGPGGLDPRYSD